MKVIHETEKAIKSTWSGEPTLNIKTSRSCEDLSFLCKVAMRCKGLKVERNSEWGYLKSDFLFWGQNLTIKVTSPCLAQGVQGEGGIRHCDILGLRAYRQRRLFKAGASSSIVH